MPLSKPRRGCRWPCSTWAASPSWQGPVSITVSSWLRYWVEAPQLELEGWSPFEVLTLSGPDSGVIDAGTEGCARCCSEPQEHTWASTASAPRGTL